MAEYHDSLVTAFINSGLNLKIDEPAGQDNNQNVEKVLMPILVEDSTVRILPPNLIDIIEKLSQNGGSPTNKFDLLTSVIYVLMIESGFIPKNSEFEIESIDFHKERILFFNYLPENWKNQNGTYVFEMCISFQKDKSLKLVLVPIQNIFNINVIFDGEIKFVCGISANRYVVSEDAVSLPLKFRNLKELSQIVKDNISNKTKIEILKDLDITEPILEDMPSEILYQISKFLKVKDFSKLVITCQRLKDFENIFNDTLWKYYLERDFPNFENCCMADSTWKQKYKKAFKRQKNFKSIPEITYCLQ